MPIPAQNRERIVDYFLELLLQDLVWKDVELRAMPHCFSRRGHKSIEGRNPESYTVYNTENGMKLVTNRLKLPTFYFLL